MKRVVVVGGGTGNFVVLSGLKKHKVKLSAVVSMADSGGSTGLLRDELGVLPPGDVRQCLVALSNSSNLMRSLINYRFDGGGLKGHSFGNLLLSALEKVTGNFEKAVDEVGKILVISGKVIPVTTNHVHLQMVLKDGKMLVGESAIYKSTSIENGYSSIFLSPKPKANPKAIEEIEKADLIVMGPGGIYTSIIPNLLVEGVAKAICRSKAKKVFIVNLMNRKGQTSGYKSSDNLKEITKFLKRDVFDYIFVNRARPEKKLMDKYANEGEFIDNDLFEKRVVFSDFLGCLKDKPKNDLIERCLIRHDSDKLAREILKIVNNL